MNATWKTSLWLLSNMCILLRSLKKIKNSAKCQLESLPKCQCQTYDIKALMLDLSVKVCLSRWGQRDCAWNGLSLNEGKGYLPCDLKFLIPNLLQACFLWRLKTQQIMIRYNQMTVFLFWVLLILLQERFVILVYRIIFTFTPVILAISWESRHEKINKAITSYCWKFKMFKNFDGCIKIPVPYWKEVQQSSWFCVMLWIVFFISSLWFVN